MSLETILRVLSDAKSRYEPEGFLILGIFGSYARNQADEQSDIDILVDTTEGFAKRYRGFRAFSRFEEIKQALKATLHKEIDFVDRQGLIRHRNAHILDRALYVE
ncbi:MAG: nucleotidyltransferase domain-containing protein [Campylobacterales bacterium]|nr:nucleotidyltransferase domain-containing protein [Campylobacterales bacterium]